LTATISLSQRYYYKTTMALFPIHRYRLLDDPFDRFFGDQLDFFDPWRDFDTYPTALSILPNTFRWVNQPPRLTHSQSIEPSEKFRVQINIADLIQKLFIQKSKVEKLLLKLNKKIESQMAIIIFDNFENHMIFLNMLVSNKLF